MFFNSINNKNEIETYEMVPNDEKIRQYRRITMDNIPVEWQGLLSAKTNNEYYIPYRNNNLFVHSYQIEMNDQDNNYHLMNRYPRTKKNMDAYRKIVQEYCDGIYHNNYIIYVDKSKTRLNKIFDKAFVYVDEYKFSKDEYCYQAKRVIQVPEELFWLDALLHEDFNTFKCIEDEKMAIELLSLFDFKLLFEPIPMQSVSNIQDELIKRRLIKSEDKSSLEQKIKSTEKYLKLVKSRK